MDLGSPPWIAVEHALNRTSVSNLVKGNGGTPPV